MNATRRSWYFTVVGLLGLAFVAATLVVPLVTVVGQSLSPSTANYTDAFDNPIFRTSLVNTAKLSVVVTALCVVAAYPYAYAMAASGPGLRRLLGAALLLSFWTSLLVRTYAWQVLLSDTGVINTLLREAGLIHTPITMIRTPFAVYLGMTQILLPFAVFALFAQLRTLPGDLVLAARSMGATRFRAFWSVVFPLTLPGAAAGAVLTFVLCLGYYITPQILGGSGRPTVGAAIVQQISTLLNTGVGAAEATLLIVAVVVCLVVAGRFVGIGQVLGLAEERRR